MTTNSVGQSAFQLAYEYSPILLTDGILGSVLPVPITVITEALDVPGIYNKEIFAHFEKRKTFFLEVRRVTPPFTSRLRACIVCLSTVRLY